MQKMLNDVKKRPSAAFVCSYACRELFPLSLSGKGAAERFRSFLRSIRESLPTFLSILSTAVLIFATAVIGGIVIGANGFMEKKITSNPLALCIDANCLVGSTAKSIDQDLLDKLSSLSRIGTKVKPDPTGAYRKERVLQGSFPWIDVSLWFFRKDGNPDTHYTDGRTASPADLIYGKLTFLHGRPAKSESPFSALDAAEIIVSERVLKDLGYSPQNPPSSLRIDYNEVHAPLRLVGVTTFMPSADEFLLPDEFYWKMMNNEWNPDPEHRHAFLGPSEKQQLEAIKGKAEDYVGGLRFQVTVEVEQRTGTSLWLRFESAQPLPRSFWENTFFPALRRYAADVEIVESLKEDFDDPLPPRWKKRYFQRSYLHSALYVKQIRDMPGTVEAIRKLGLSTNPEVLERIILMQQVSAFGRGTFLCVAAIIGVVSVSNILLSFWQSIRRKTPEIGIFKAFGASNRLVTTIYLMESLMIWFVASLIAVPLAIMVGRSAERFLVVTFRIGVEKGEHLFSTPSWFLAAVILGSLCVAAVAALLASRVATRIQPAEAVRMVGSL